VIFATTVLLLPSLIITAIPSDAGWIQAIYRWINTNLGSGQAGVSWWYILILFGLIVFFTYFYTAIQFDPEQQAEMIQRQGGFIPGVRPGRQTSKHLAGAIWGIQIAFSGVSILIVVGVALETMKQIESQLTMRNYEGILT
jgi:preprotein translocase subunit SecY